MVEIIGNKYDINYCIIIPAERLTKIMPAELDM